VRAELPRLYEAPLLRRIGGPAEGAQVMEIGCGRGVGTQLILDIFGVVHITAVDVDPDMDHHARDCLAGHGDRVIVAIGDAERLHTWPKRAPTPFSTSGSSTTSPTGAPQ
jgi:trans-aconitate methyltransferase